MAYRGAEIKGLKDPARLLKFVSVALCPLNTVSNTVRSHLQEQKIICANEIGNLPEGRRVISKYRVHNGREGRATDAAAL